MIDSSHTIRVKFTPVKRGESFSNEIMSSVRGTCISGGSYSSYPHVRTTRDNMEDALKVERLYKTIIIKYGGTIINES